MVAGPTASTEHCKTAGGRDVAAAAEARRRLRVPGGLAEGAAAPAPTGTSAGAAGFGPAATTDHRREARGRRSLRSRARHVLKKSQEHGPPALAGQQGRSGAGRAVRERRERRDAAAALHARVPRPGAVQPYAASLLLGPELSHPAPVAAELPAKLLQFSNNPAKVACHHPALHSWMRGSAR